MAGERAPARLSSRLLDMKFMRNAAAAESSQQNDASSKDASPAADSKTPALKARSEFLDAPDPSAWTLIPVKPPNNPPQKPLGFSDLYEQSSTAGAGRRQYRDGKQIEREEPDDADNAPDFDEITARKRQEQKDSKRAVSKKRKSGKSAEETRKKKRKSV